MCRRPGLVINSLQNKYLFLLINDVNFYITLIVNKAIKIHHWEMVSIAH